MDQKDELQEMDSEEIYSVPQNERKFFGQSYDLSIQTLFEQWNSGMVIIPEYQREYIWDDAKASRLIESLILNIPIPPIYIAELPDGGYEIVDGHQRVRAIVRYFCNEFKLSGLRVLIEYQGKNNNELPLREQRVLKMRMLRTVIITLESHPNMKFEIFERLNTGSILLNPQELRNALYRGSFNDMLRKDLVNNSIFRALIGKRSPRKRMVDEELILRFFALKDDYDIYKTPLKRFLNEYMDKHKHEGHDWLKEQKSVFVRTITKINQVFGHYAFRVADEKGIPIEQSLNRALYDAQMLTFSWLDNQSITVIKAKILKELASVYKVRDFQEAIGRATNDRARLRLRVRSTAEALRRAGCKMTIPFELD